MVNSCSGSQEHVFRMSVYSSSKLSSSSHPSLYAMALSLGNHAIFLSAFAFSHPNTGIHTVAKPAKLELINALGVSLNSIIAGTIALGFFTDNIGFQTFDNGVWKAPIYLQERRASSTPTEPPRENQRPAHPDRCKIPH